MSGSWTREPSHSLLYRRQSLHPRRDSLHQAWPRLRRRRIGTGPAPPTDGDISSSRIELDSRLDLPEHGHGMLGAKDRSSLTETVDGMNGQKT